MWGLRGESRSGATFCLVHRVEKYSDGTRWTVRSSYKWQIGNLKLGSWTISLRQDLEKKVFSMYLEKTGEKGVFRQHTELLKPGAAGYKRRWSSEMCEERSGVSYWEKKTEWREKWRISILLPYEWGRWDNVLYVGNLETVGIEEGRAKIRCLICREKGNTVELQGEAKMGWGEREFWNVSVWM